MNLKSLVIYGIAIFLTLCLLGFKHIQPITASFASEMLNLVNQVRSQGQMCGGVALAPVEALMLNTQLNQAAQLHSDDMASNNILSHTGSNGSSFDQRIETQGFVFAFAGENVAAGKRIVEDTLEQWLSSEGHCRNIMSPNFSQMGLGVSENPSSRYKVYWAQVFAAPFGTTTDSGSADNSSVVFSSPLGTISSPDNSNILPSSNNKKTADESASNQTTSQADKRVVSGQNNTQTTNKMVEELMNLINQARSQSQVCGGETFSAVSALSINTSLMQAAQGHSSSMAGNNFFGQTGLDGQNFDKRVEAQGYSFSFVAENIIAGRATVTDVMASLLETDGYCRGLMSTDYTELGIGFAENLNSQYKYYWTLTFAKPL